MGAKHAAHSSRFNQTHEKQDFLFLLRSYRHKISKAQLMLHMDFYVVLELLFCCFYLYYKIIASFVIERNILWLLTY